MLARKHFHHGLPGCSRATRGRRSLRAVAGALSGAALLVAAGLGACSEAPRSPDVILLSLDSVRADTLTFRDEALTPALTTLARSGTTFKRAISGSSWTLPAHAQMFTGQPPLLHGVQDDERRIDPLTRTLPECLADAGFATLGFWSGWFLAAEYGFGRGFDHYESALELDAAVATQGEDDDPRDDFVRREHSSHRQITSQRILDLARAALDDVPESRPLFLFAHFFDPHYDYIPPPPFDTRFDPGYSGDIDGRDYWANRRIFDPERSPMRQIADRDLEHVRALYRGELAWTDQVIGKLLDLLESKGRLANALIIVTSDHGEEFFEHGNRGHRQTLYEEVLRVPLLVVRPGATPAPSGASARTEGALVSLSDLMPTILETVGAPRPASVWGRSLVPLLGGRAPSEAYERSVISTLTTMVEGKGGSATLIMDSLHTGSAKFLRQVRIPADGKPEVESVQWFDLAADRAELRPRSDIGRPEVAAAWGRLERDMERLRAFHATLPHSPPAERHTDVRQIFASELGALGYAEGPEARAPASQGRWTLEPLPALRPR